MPGVITPDQGSGGLLGSCLGRISGETEEMTTVYLEDQIQFTMQFTDPATGARADPTTPTVRVYNDNTGSVISGFPVTPTKVDSKTGFYNSGSFTVSTANYSVNTFYTVWAAATVAGVDCAGIIGRFVVRPGTGGRGELAAAGLDQIADAVPTAHPTTFPTKLMALAARFVNKHTRDRAVGTISVYADDHTTVALTQTTTPDDTYAATDTVSQLD